jgi:hypothetical protein
MQAADSTSECAFYYPEDRSFYRAAKVCGLTARREFSASTFDEGDKHFDVSSAGLCVRETVCVASAGRALKATG